MDASIVDLAKPVLDAIMHGHGWLGAASALVLVVALLRRWGTARWPALGGKAGGAALNLLTAFGGAAATALLAGQAPSVGLALAALKVSGAAAAGFELVKELAAPALRWGEARAPGWLRPVLKPALDLLLWAFEKRGDAAVAAAKAAGDAAVAAKPAAGAAAVVDVEELK